MKILIVVMVSNIMLQDTPKENQKCIVLSLKQ